MKAIFSYLNGWHLTCAVAVMAISVSMKLAPLFVHIEIMWKKCKHLW
jgi:hypothetical protein